MNGRRSFDGAVPCAAFTGDIVGEVVQPRGVVRLPHICRCHAAPPVRSAANPSMILNPSLSSTTAWFAGNYCLSTEGVPGGTRYKPGSAADSFAGIWAARDTLWLA